ncbi:putative ferric-chelate reductase 1 isoform X2 [Neoarius graeffei]|uniref:putative ferric-chelate reductase 1 isoform X2 n=1 Tax=Neoarius graeffei TaxID=443677 RepID=UPI00298C56D0|nr:putative ferric-chelate reductase 1 isoform X2 [Neoarius graeffei]XP_060778701.1 putative ferric-chelate reductase 1 isoform X2 [Neoarius graeffei]
MWLYVVLLGCVWVCESFRNGQVSSSCSNMIPSHGTVAQTSAAPYTVTADSSSYKEGDTITVTLNATPGSFKGFLLEARLVGGNSAVGSFSVVDSNSQFLTCSGVSNSAVSHTSGSSKSQIQSTWKAPTSGNLNNIEFRVTFVRDYNAFWVGVKSAMITYIGTATGATSSSISTSSTSSSISSTGCGSSKTCLSEPTDCDPSTNSDCYFMSATPLSSGSGFMLELSGRVAGYIAIGFSDDRKMGNDDIYICGKDMNGVIQVQHAFSRGTTTPTTITLGNVTVINTSQSNGVISCSFTSRNIIRTTRSSTHSNNYYIFLANGATSNGVIQIHTTRPLISSAKVDLNNPQTLIHQSGFPPIVKAHGCLMVIAWMTLGSMGMLIARFLKRLAPGQRFCGRDLWFVAHVLLMLLSVAATIIAFILIFSYAQDWSGGAHPVLGCLVMILSLAQPIGAMFRCSPQDERRFIFNWVHAINALAIKGLAVAAIFTGLLLVDSSDWLLKVMGGFVAWEALIFLCQDLYHRCIQKDMDEGSVGGVGTGMLLLMFFFGNLAFLVALLVGIGKA